MCCFLQPPGIGDGKLFCGLQEQDLGENGGGSGATEKQQEQRKTPKKAISIVGRDRNLKFILEYSALKGKWNKPIIFNLTSVI